MSKSILYRWFGLRKVPIKTRTKLVNEGILFDEEGTSCALSYRNFRGPRNYSGRGWEGGAVGTLVITQKTFYVQFPYMILCDQPIEEAVRHLELELKGPAKLVMRFVVEKLFEQATGQLTCYWRTENAAAILIHIRNLQARHASDGQSVTTESIVGRIAQARHHFIKTLTHKRQIYPCLRHLAAGETVNPRLMSVI